MTLTLATAGSGVARTAHYVIPTGATTPIQTLLVEPQRTNRVLQSQTLGDAAWVATNVSVTADNENAPDGTATADTLDATVNGGSLVQAVTFTGSTGTRAFSVFLKVGTAAATDLEVYDVTAAASLRVVRVTWTGGVPAVTSVSGAGTIHTVVALANGWYRIRFNANAVIPGAGRTEVRIFPASASTGTVIAWGVQGDEDSVANTPTPTQYIATVGSAVTRNQDALVFSLSFPPQALTFYYRGTDTGYREFGATLNRAMFSLGSTFSIPPGTLTFQSQAATSTSYTLFWAGTNGVIRGSGTVDFASVVMGDLIEVRGVLTAGWQPQFGLSVNGGAETVSTLGLAGDAATAWNANTFRFGGALLGRQTPTVATHFIVAAGNQTLATMRTLAGVA